MPAPPDDLQIERHLDGIEIQWESPGMARATMVSWGMLLVIVAVVMPAFIVATMLLALDSCLPSAMMLMSVVAIWRLHRVLLQPFRDQLRAHFAYGVALRGQTMTLHSPLGPLRLPLAEVAAIDQSKKALVTNSFEHLQLAPRAPEARREQIVRALEAHLALRSGGSVDDVPAALRAMQQERSSDR